MSYRGEATENKKHKWSVQNRQGEIKNSIGNVEAKELGPKEAYTKAHQNYITQE